MNKYADYRDYIADLVIKNKKESKVFSFQIFSKQVGTSRSYLKLVIDKKRHISIDRLLPIAKYFKLSEYESYYLIFLFFSNITTEDNLKYLFNGICSRIHVHFLQRLSNHPYIKEQKLTSLDTSWIEPAIYALAFFEEFSIDASWILKKLGGEKYLNEAQIKKSLKDLIESKRLIQKANRFIPADNVELKCADPVLGLDIKNFLTGVLRTQLALENFEDESLHQPGYFQMYSIACSEKDSEVLLNLYKDFNDKLLQFMNEQDNQNISRVMFVSNNVFAISRKN